MGRGVAGIDGLDVGDVVTGEQMRLLFAEGRHPLAGQASPGKPGPELLGVPFRTVEGVERPFRRELRARYAAHAESLGLSSRAGLPAETRARIRTDLALEWFRDADGREPKGDVELTSAVCKVVAAGTGAGRGVRPHLFPRQVSLCPVGPVGAGGGGADRSSAPGRGHRCAGLAGGPCLVQPGGYGRGTSGERHRVGRRLVHPSRQPRRDPDLHTHVAVANKVQTRQGRWLSIDGRVLHAAATAVSETYNTALETRLTHQLGVRFADRPGRDRSKRPVREIVGLDPALLGRWSSRRRAIDVLGVTA